MRFKTMGRAIFVLLLLIFISGYNCIAQERDTLNVLFVGNSYIYVSNIPQLVSLISDSTSTKLITKKSIAGGARLSQHWKGERGLETKKMIRSGEFDIVVLQEQSMGTIEYPDTFLLYSQKFSKLIKDSGAEPYFYQTWAREKVPQYQETISSVYEKAAKENDASLVPVGESWAVAQHLRPGIDLYMDDGSHQSDLGAFLSACVFVKAFTDELPEQLRNTYTIMDSEGESVMLSRVETLDIQFFLKVANQILSNHN